MKWFLFCVLALMACGQDRTVKEYVVDPGDGDGSGNGGSGSGGDGGGSGSVSSYTEVKKILDAKCAPCHNSNVKFMQSESGLKGSGVPNRVRSRSMPPPASGVTLSDWERKAILSFFP